MPTIVWILFWAAAIGVVAFFTVREIRAKKPPINDFDTMDHEAVRQAHMNRDRMGPNGGASLWGP